MGRRKGDLGVNKKGTPLYSREDIREQYCINDKEPPSLRQNWTKRNHVTNLKLTAIFSESVATFASESPLATFGNFL